MYLLCYGISSQYLEARTVYTFLKSIHARSEVKERLEKHSSAEISGEKASPLRSIKFKLDGLKRVLTWTHVLEDFLPIISRVLPT